MKKYLQMIADSLKALVGFAKSADNISVTNSVPAYKDGINYTESQLKLIDSIAASRRQDIKGYASAKRKAKRLLSLFSMTIIGPARACCLTNKDDENATKLNVTFTQLYTMEDGLLAGFCEGLHKLIEPMLIKLSNFGVTQAGMDKWTNMITAYKNLVSSPRNAIAKRAVETIDVERLVIDLNEYVRVTLAAMVEVFRDSNPSYYMSFAKNLQQIERGHHFTRLECECVIEDSGTAIPGAICKLDDTGLSCITNSEGIGMITGIPRKGKAISVYAAGYIPVEHVAVAFANGKTTKVKIAMRIDVNIESKMPSKEKVN